MKSFRSILFFCASVFFILSSLLFLGAKGGCPVGMVSVPGGAYTIGSDSWWRKWAIKKKEVRIESFCMDVYEWPNVWGEMPLVNIPIQKARELCASKGKRLCTLEEWLAACQGKQGNPFSYGSKKEVRRCNTNGQLLRGGQEILPSGVFNECVSKDGVHDLNGNVSEFVESDMYSKESVLLGDTAWFSDWYGQDCTSLHHHPDDSQAFPDDGFRCCK